MKHLKNAVVILLLLFSPTIAFGQLLELGTLSDFEAFTGNGAVTGPGNLGTCIGDVGTDTGIISGFDTSYSGTKHRNNALTSQARIDLLKVYIHLSLRFVTHANTHAAAFGSGETITPGVYSIDGAGSISGILTLNGGGDTNAVFIVRFDGAFAMAASSTIVLSGGTRACNVYWIAEGGVSAGAGCTIKGTLFSHFGVVTLGAGCDLEGRMFASGAITFGAASDAIIPVGHIAIPTRTPSIRPPAAAVDVLGSIDNFVLFSSSGAVSNTASSGFVGDIGTNLGAITGFATSTHIGSSFTANSTTAQAKIDLDSAYNKLIAIPKTDSTHAAVFGGGETLTAGVYYVAAAGSLAGTITLDGQNDSDAIFIIRFNGAFSVGAQSNVVLTNRTRFCNVFWIAEGAASMASYVNMKGTVFSHGAACSMAANGNLEGRMLTTSGAVSFSTGVIYVEPLYFSTSAYLPMELLSFTAEVKDGFVQLNWVTTAEINIDFFNVEQSVDGVNFTSISKIKGAGDSKQLLEYSSVHHALLEGVSYYRLKQTNYDGKSSYSEKEIIQFETKEVIFDIYPNPFSGETTFHTSENLNEASFIFYNSNGAVKQIENISGKRFVFQCENLRSGLYWIKVVQGDKVIAIKKFIITD